MTSTIQVPATCTVDDIGGMHYEVVVTGGGAFADHTRTYTLKATSEDKAAFAGLAEFVSEMECLSDATMKEY